MAELTQDVVLNALRKVNDPDLHKDLVTLNMIKDLKVDPSGDVSVRVVLTTPACPLKAKIEQDVRAAIQALPGVGKIDIKMDAVVKSGRTSPTKIQGVSHVIAVSSGKGGVGKSTVAVNLACALAREGAKVGLMDADIYGPNVPTMMGLGDAEPQVIDDPEKGEMMVPPVAHGVKVMSMGFLLEGDQPVVWRGPMLHGVINQFCHKVKWGELDYLVVDMPPGTGDVQLSLGQLVPVSGAVLVTTPQEVSAQDVRKAIRMFEKVGVPLFGIVENMSFFRCDGCGKVHHPFGTEGGQKLAKQFDAELLAELPIVQQVREAGDTGKPAVLGETEAAQAFLDLGRKVARMVSICSAD